MGQAIPVREVIGDVAMASIFRRGKSQIWWIKYYASVPEGSVTLLKVTWKGKSLLESQGVQIKALPKNASLEHEYWKKIVAEKYRSKGYKVEYEVPIGNGKAVDLVATKEGKRIAIEVETGKSDVDGNVKKCEQAGFNKVVSIYTKKTKL